MPRLSLLACDAECHHANAEAEPPGMSGGQGKDETKESRTGDKKFAVLVYSLPSLGCLA